MKKLSLISAVVVLGLSLSTISWAEISPVNNATISSSEDSDEAVVDGDSETATTPDDSDTNDSTDEAGDTSTGSTDDSTTEIPETPDDTETSGEGDDNTENPGEGNAEEPGTGEGNTEEPGTGEGDNSEGNTEEGGDTEDGNGEEGGDTEEPEENPWPASMASGTLPILHINTENATPIVDKVTQIPAGLWVEIPEGCSDTSFALGSEDAPITLTIKGRGNSTWLVDKKPYKLKFDKKQKFVGMPKHKHFALLACYSGYTDWVAQALGKELARNVGMGWAPHMEPVELVLNDEYLGLYFVTESIKIDENRLNIYAQPDLNTDPETIPYGWLCEIDNYADECQIIVPENSQRNLRVTYHSPEELSEEQETWLTNEFTSLCSTIYTTNTASHWVDYIDENSLAQYFIVREIMTDKDGFNGSMYMYRPAKDADSDEDSRWHFGPMWDNTFYETSDPTYWTRDSLPSWATYRLMTPILNTQIFQNVFLNVWKDVYESDVLPQLYTFIKDFGMKCYYADQVNAIRWGKSSKVSEKGLSNICNLIQTKADWIEGHKNYLESTSGIASIIGDVDSVDAIATYYYTIDGAKVEAKPTAPGIYIKQEILQNGEQRNIKILVR